LVQKLTKKKEKRELKNKDEQLENHEPDEHQTSGHWYGTLNGDSQSQFSVEKK
jgi:hypothetical protein